MRTKRPDRGDWALKTFLRKASSPRQSTAANRLTQNNPPLILLKYSNFIHNRDLNTLHQGASGLEFMEEDAELVGVHLERNGLNIARSFRVLLNIQSELHRWGIQVLQRAGGEDVINAPFNGAELVNYST